MQELEEELTSRELELENSIAQIERNEEVRYLLKSH